MKHWGRPRRSIRLRLAALLTGLFVLLGATLLTVSYGLVRSNLTVDPRRLAETAADRLGLQRGTGQNGESGHTGPTSAQAAPDHRRFVAQIETVQQELADEALRELTIQYAAIMAAMALLSAALGWSASGRVLRPVRAITATARRVSNESLHERIALEGPDDELKQLADTFDSMLARLEAGFDRQAAFVRNASHELRTPLSVIRTEADVTLADEADDPAALRRALGVVREAGERSERLIEALLVLARADRGGHPRTDVDVAEVAREVTDDVTTHGGRLELALEPAHVLGDPQLLRTMIANLVANAARHNTPDGWITVRTRADDRQAHLEVANSGPMVTAEEAARLAEPFRQLRTARTGEGFGLGLSIASSVAQAHGGRLALEPLDGGGLQVSVALPARRS